MERIRRVNLIATSPEVRALMAERRHGAPVLLPGDVKDLGEVVLPPNDVAECKIDETYQRAEVRDMVLELSHVLQSGGVIPDPVSVAERPDGTRWVVDGQQRYWAYLDCGKPMVAKLYKVASREAELKLFDVLNHTVALNSTIRVKGWPGPSAALLRELDESPESPMRGHLGWQGRVKTTYSVGVLLRGLATLLSSSTGMSGAGTRNRLMAVDAYYLKNKTWGHRACFEYAALVVAVVPLPLALMLRGAQAVALARTARLRWTGLYERASAEWPHPSDGQVVKLRLLDWDTLTPTTHERWVTAAQEAIEKLWPLPAKLNRVW